MPKSKLDSAYERAEQRIRDVLHSGAPELSLRAHRDAAESKLDCLPLSIARLTHLRSLDVSGNNLAALPDSLMQLSQLEHLSVGGNKLESLPEWLASLSKLKTLNLAENPLTSLPRTLARLAKLQSLRLGGLKLAALPKWISELRELETLDISAIRLETLPDWIGVARRLRDLNVSSNRLQRLPDSICALRNIVSLDVSSNSIRELPAAIGSLTSLESFDAHNNNIDKLPESLAELGRLRKLILTSNPLTSLAPRFGNLQNLESLTLGDTRLRSLPPSMRQLTKLQRLVLSYTPLTELPSWFGELRELRGLNLVNSGPLVISWDERLASWYSSGPVRKSAGLRRLPQSLQGLPNLQELYLHGNELLGLPKEVLGPEWEQSRLYQGRAAAPAASEILAYYFRAQHGKRPLNEAKLILVGRGGVGKTSLIKRLIHGKFDRHEPETPGIEIQSWQLALSDGESVRMHVWDFGGQEILHATHQFFLTERTVYLLVLSGREGTATEDAEYWLQLIRSFGGDSPVVIALNKIQQHPFDVNRGLLLEKYPQITAFIHTDCEQRPDGAIAQTRSESTGIVDLERSLVGATTNLEHRKADFPADWFAIKERLAGMTENFLTWDEYQQLCTKFGEQDVSAQHNLASYLHILGIALNYRDDPRLRDTHVLNPRWVTEGIYAILRVGHKERHQRKGVLDPADLTDVLDISNYPPKTHDFLLALMEKFQLCFPLPGTTRQYLVPELLGENQPAEIQTMLAAPGLSFRFQYEVLPQGVLPRFIVQTHTYSEPNPHWRWRSGVVLSRSGCRAVVRADPRERRVDVHITGGERARRDLLAIIRDRFDEQHRDLKGLVVDPRVPIPEEPTVTVSYNFLVALENEGETWCRPEGARKKYAVAELLNGIEPADRRTKKDAITGRDVYKTEVKKEHVFLSYCHDNAHEVRRLRDDLLAAGEHVWWDDDILPGSDWKLAIHEALKAAYAVVLCLSVESQARTKTGIYPEALDAISAVREYAPGSVFLIPVRLSNCTIPPLEIDGVRRLDRLQFTDLFPPADRAANVAKLVKAIKTAPEHP